MKTRNVLFWIFVLFTVTLCTVTLAGSHQRNTTQLKNIEQLVLITQHLDLESRALVDINEKQPERSCFCACDDYSSRWICTTKECKSHDKTCSNEIDENR
ncbi:MAG: hypothetical protein ACD_62C00622G0004 [uncultured bacterium]|nr:MAG: hypothetical protein ACD_62C00622G0004 [uncultured bacterium]HLD45627.1 hypothetical protein [bacterium]